MLTPILATKLYIPSPRPKNVPRPRLIERLDEGITAGRKLTLVSAPAGFGKTTLLSSWIAADPKSKIRNRVAWLSLDEGDSDLTRFLAYLIAAMQTVATDIGTRVLAALQSPQPPTTEALLTALLNEIATIPDDFLLILDDYHLADVPPVDQALAFLVEYLPPQMHLVLATREDPHLPLARLRARGQLTELHAADLRFTPAEAAEFLNQMMCLGLSAENIAALETRTEGWIAGLQLAALALQGTLALQGALAQQEPLSGRGASDVASFIQSFSGSHRFVLDYLVGEVLEHQPGHVRSFLLQTAILDRLSGPLCDAVTKREDGKGMLDALERGNLFVVPLDDERRWYRYHHLFADVLQARLTEEQPDQVPGLHQRASTWYEQNGLLSQAIHHALAVEDFEHAAGLIEQVWQAMDISYQSATWLGWAKVLPDDLIRARPVLSVGYAWALLDGGEMEASEARLQDAERWLDESADIQKTGQALPAEMIVVDKKEFRSLPASIATARAYRALALGDVPAAVEYGRLALTLTPEEDQLRRVQAISLLGVAQYANGNLAAADRSLTDFQADLRKTGDILTAMGITFVLANIKVARGRLHEAANAYQQILQLVIGQGEPLPVGTSDLYRGLSELYCEWNDLEAAAQYLLTAKKLGEQAALTGWQHRFYVAEAHIKEAQGDLEGALESLNKAERLYIESPLPDVHPIAALKARIWIAQGRLADALAWVRERGLSAGDELSYLREFEHLTLARVLIARYKRDRAGDSIREAMGLLDRLQQAAEAGDRMGSVIEILVVQALAYQAQGNLPHAFKSLEHALTLAEPEGYVRIFVDEGEPMRSLILDCGLWIEKQSRGQGPQLIGYGDRLLTAFAQLAATQPSKIKKPKSKIIEPLSERELEVLRLLGTELSGPEIARELVVSLSTVRTHTQAIYTKLGVNNRRAAIRRAEELDLL